MVSNTEVADVAAKDRGEIELCGEEAGAIGRAIAQETLNNLDITRSDLRKGADGFDNQPFIGGHHRKDNITPTRPGAALGALLIGDSPVLIDVFHDGRANLGDQGDSIEPA